MTTPCVTHHICACQQAKLDKLQQERDALRAVYDAACQWRHGIGAWTQEDTDSNHEKLVHAIDRAMQTSALLAKMRVT